MLKKILPTFALALAATSFGFADEAEEPKDKTAEERVCDKSAQSCEQQEQDEVCENQTCEAQENSN